MVPEDVSSKSSLMLNSEDDFSKLQNMSEVRSQPQEDNMSVDDCSLDSQSAKVDQVEY